jgi:hypothetical protein
MANLYVAAGVGGGPSVEFPYDPPGWTERRRDFSWPSRCWRARTGAFACRQSRASAWKSTSGRSPGGRSS